MHVVFVLFILLTGPKGEPTLVTQEFNSEYNCKQAVEALKRNENKGFSIPGGGYWTHASVAWCVEK